MGMQAHARGVDQYVRALGDAGRALPGNESGPGAGVVADGFGERLSALGVSVDDGNGGGPGQGALDADASRRAARAQQADGGA